MAMDEAKKYELEELIQELEGYRGRHTELITVYIPADYNLNNVIKQIDSEKGTADNIKSKNTRKAVVDALERISRQLKLIAHTPKNGFAVFCGNVSETEGQEDIRIWTVEAPEPLNVKLYRCDQTFVLDPLKEMVASGEIYALLIIERKEATIGLLEGKSLKVLQHMTSGIPGKVKAGGQSAARYSRVTENMAKEFFRRVAEAMKAHFFDLKGLKGILVGGPIPTKDEFLETGNLVTALKNKVIAVKDIGGSELNGLQELVEACKDVLVEQGITKQKKLLDNFFSTLGKTPKMVVYGEPKVVQKLEEGNVRILIVSQSLPKEKIRNFQKLAADISAEIHLVSKETQEGIQFDNLGGVGAIIRYAVE